MPESARKKQRVSPVGSDSSDSADRTLHADLQQLAHIIPKPVTPYRRAVSVGATPGSARTPVIHIRTPGAAAARTPRGGPSTRTFQARRAAPTTPHAIRALRERAAGARTPGRRRSGRVQRETPRDLLRALSRTLARETKPVEPSSDTTALAPRNPVLDLLDVEDDDPDPVRPRLSMPLDDMYDDDSIHEPPPRQSLLYDLQDDGDTIHSLEYGRRAFSEDPRAMFKPRLSERFGDLNELGITEEEYEVDGTFITRRPAVDPDQLLQDMEQALEDTGEMEGFSGRQQGRPSDGDLGMYGDMDEQDEPTFRFTVPQRIRAPARQEPSENPQEEDDVDADVEAGAEEDIDASRLPVVDEEATEGFDHAGWESDHDAEEDVELQAYREEESAIDRSLLTQADEQDATQQKRSGRQRKERHLSKIGLEYPSFPAPTVKRIVAGLAKSQGGNAKISKDTLAALVQTTDWFFEQVSEDLAAYAQHAGRKVIEEADMITLMKRQRLLTKNTTAFSLAQKMLPRELLQELRMPPVTKVTRQKRKRLEVIQEDEED